MQLDLLENVLQTTAPTHVVLRPSLRGADDARKIAGTVVVGGSLSPLFLRSAPNDTPQRAVPFTQALTNTRIVVSHRNRVPYPHWVPFLTKLTERYETLLVICDDMDDALLQTLLVNETRGTLRGAVARCEARSLPAIAQHLSMTPLDGGTPPPEDPGVFPMAQDVVVRADATQLLGLGSDTLVEVQVGGRNAEEVRERLVAALRRLGA